MGKNLSEKQKEDIVKFFISGKTADELSQEFNFTKLTIIRNLKKILGEKKFKELINKNKLTNKKTDDLKTKFQNENFSNKNLEDNLVPITPFIEIAPLNLEIENTNQKDLSSVPIAEINFPKIVYMIVDKKIELEVKLLKEYPEWQFLSKDELSRETIEIYTDLKVAKRFCNKEQKVIKVPNSAVFKIVAPLLVSRGISRIVSPDKLIAL